MNNFICWGHYTYHTFAFKKFAIRMNDIFRNLTPVSSSMKTLFLLADHFDYYRKDPKIGFKNLISILVHIIILRPYYVPCFIRFLDFIYVVIKPQLTVADMPPRR